MSAGIDWEKFAQRIPMGTRYKRTGGKAKRFMGQEGILMTNHFTDRYPLSGSRNGSGVVPRGRVYGPTRWTQHGMEMIHIQPFDWYSALSAHPSALSFLIENRWVAFEEIMK